MRLWSLVIIMLVGCNNAGYRAVSIRPSAGWIDGCTDVRISGHGFGDEVSATVGGAEVMNITRPTGEIQGDPDSEFYFFASTPAGDAPGDVAVFVTSDGDEDEIPQGFYYLACWGDPYIDSMSPDEGVASGDAISLRGCNIDADTYSITVTDPTGTTADQDVALTEDCLTAYASFTAPSVPDGTYYVLIKSGDTVLHPATGWPCQADSATYCEPPLMITYGGAE
ncbi:MAG: hypothetical protein JRJ84_02865 [Deltaproteobacteria bacterium]|nr:hypothetical protein [Deltaproteobacteria bacterium]